MLSKIKYESYTQLADFYFLNSIIVSNQTVAFDEVINNNDKSIIVLLTKYNVDTIKLVI
jgi:hypothetical protein